MDTLLFNYGFTQLELHTALLSFLLCFLLSSLIATVYSRTFQGLSYSTGLIQSMILGSVISCLLMIAIGDNVARGIGIVGSLAIIRFRTNLRDPRDLVFLFASLGVGVACGVQSYTTAFVGSATFILVAMLLFYFDFGNRRSHDGLVRFQVPTGSETSDQITRVMKKIPKRFALVTLRDIAQGKAMDFSYQIKLHHPEDSTALVDALMAVDGIRGLTFINQESTVEV